MELIVKSIKKGDRMEGKTILNISNVCFETIECCNCHLIFAVTKQHRNSLIEAHETFYCPNGHPQSYVSKTDADKWKETANNLHKQLGKCQSEGTELVDEINVLSEKNKLLKKENKGLKIVKSRYKNKLKHR